MVPEMFDFRGLRVSKITLYLSQLEVEAKTLESYLTLHPSKGHVCRVGKPICKTLAPLFIALLASYQAVAR